VVLHTLTKTNQSLYPDSSEIISASRITVICSRQPKHPSYT